MKRGSTNFLRLAIFIMGMLVITFFVLTLPELMKGGSAQFPMIYEPVLLIIMGMYATTIPFFIALWQALKILNLIDQNKAFSTLSVKALRKIKYCASIIAVLYIGGVPLLFPIADAGDAPGVVSIGMVVAFATLTSAVFAAILEKLLQSAIDIKNENDLTV